MTASDISPKTLQRLNYAVGYLVDVFTMPVSYTHLIGMTGILLVIGFLVLVVMALNCLTRDVYKRQGRVLL